MEIRVAKTAGFCFGVKRAVDLTYGLLNEGCKVATLGPLIHNPQAVEDMQKKGALVADAIADVPAGYEVVIRSHGVPRTVYDELDARGVLLVYRKKAVGAYLLERPSGVVVGLKDMQAAMAEAEAKQTSGEDYEGDWGERHDEELTGSEPAQQTSGEDYSGDWGERHDEELTAQQTSGEPDAVPQAVPYTELPLDAEGYPVE